MVTPCSTQAKATTQTVIRSDVVISFFDLGVIELSHPAGRARRSAGYVVTSAGATRLFAGAGLFTVAGTSRQAG